jgi:hypothetical protein
MLGEERRRERLACSVVGEVEPFGEQAAGPVRFLREGSKPRFVSTDCQDGCAVDDEL